MYFWLAIAHNKTNHPTEAIKILNLLLEIYPNFEDAIVYRAKLYLKAKKIKEAVKDFETVIKQNPKNPAAYLELGKYEDSMGNHDKAFEIWNLGRESTGEYILISVHIIENLLERKKIDEASK